MTVLQRKLDRAFRAATSEAEEGDTLVFAGGTWRAQAASGGINWQVVSTATTMAAGTAYIVTAAVDMTLPAVAAGDEFIVHAKVNGVRVVSNGNVITGVGSGNDLAIGAGETAHLVASASGTVEIV